MCTLLLGSVGLAGCLPDPECVKGETRCDGGELERCVAHGGGIYGPLDHPQHVSSSGPGWENVAACGDADRCITSPSDGAFCALDAAPSADCADPAADHACAGSTLVTCRDGYAIERKTCGTCDATFGSCADGTGDACSDSDACGGALQCNHAPFRTCELACTCPEGEPCDACGASWSQAADGGVSLHWTCEAGLCAFHY